MPAPLFDLPRDRVGGTGRWEFGGLGRMREEPGRRRDHRGTPKEEAQALVGGVGKQPFFEPIEPIDADELVLPEGFKYDIVRR